MNSLTQAIAQAVLAAVQGGEVVATATVIATSPNAPVLLGAKLLVRSNGETTGSLGGGAVEEAVVADCREGLRHHLLETYHYTPDGQRLDHLSRSALASRSYYSVLIEVFEPPVTLLVVGGGHIGKALTQLGALLGFSVAVVDERPDYCNAERFPEADHLLCGDYAEMLRGFPISPNTFIVLVTRGHKQDELSLREVIRSPARYIGMIGSKRRVTAVLQHLLAEGVAPEAVQRVHSPIGLDIGAETPEEIAVAIMAEIVLVRRGGTALPMSRLARVTEKVTAAGPPKATA